MILGAVFGGGSQGEWGITDRFMVPDHFTFPIGGLDDRLGDSHHEYSGWLGSRLLVVGC